jgi:hypothetical protein
MKKGLAAGIVLLALGLVPGIVFAQGDEAQKEVDKQVAKAISDAISARVTTQVVTDTATSVPPNNIWISGGQVMVTGSGFDLSVPAIIGGWDRDVRGKQLVGASVSLSRFDDTIRVGGFNTDIESTSLSFSPYIAFLLSPNYFVVTKASVGFTTSSTESRSTVSGFTTTSESDTFTVNYGVGGSFNGLFRPGNFVLKGAARVDLNAYSSSTSSDSETRNSSGSLVGFSSSSTSDSDSSVSYGFDGEAGVLIGSRSYLFAAYQWTDSTESGSEAQTFLNIGFEQKIGRDAGLGIKYGTSLGSKGVDVETFFITFRKAL